MGSCIKIQTAGMTLSTANILYNKYKKIAICSDLVVQYSAEDTGLPRHPPGKLFPLCAQALSFNCITGQI